ncbi:MAG: DUF2088 domain-containing protein [Planctomycetota bacterium]|nr:MAG: DUF2088 domain-containing protein [Planctomycetota bacterium]
MTEGLLPRMLRVRQHFERPVVRDVAAEVHTQLRRLNLHERVHPGQSVAITAGSRGIANIAQIIKAAVEHFRELGAAPFIVPAMGSHGGGTAEGQRRIIEEYGITEEFVGAPIRATMETVIVDTTEQGIPVHFDRFAFEADHVLVCGRVKPHTGFVGEIESGLHKMMLIGLGKHEGAKIYHRAIQEYSFLEIIRAVADVVMRRCGVVAGLAIVENAYDETALIEAVPPAEFFAREKELLRLARRWMPRLPFRYADVLIVDQIGKNISGTGMDTNVIGRKYNDHAATERDEVCCKRIVVRSLTRETHGNACGLGLAEFTTERCARQVDIVATRINCVTGGHPTGGAIPITFPNDREAIVAALQTIGLTPPDRARVMHITDTLHLSELLISEAYMPEVQRRDDLEVIREPQPMQFDERGDLLPVLPEWISSPEH